MFESEQNTIKNKKRKQNFHRIVPGFLEGFCLCVFSPTRNDLSPPQGMTPKKHMNEFLTPAQSRDNPANLFMFMCFSFPENSKFTTRSVLVRLGFWARFQTFRKGREGVSTEVVIVQGVLSIFSVAENIPVTTTTKILPRALRYKWEEHWQYFPFLTG